MADILEKLAAGSRERVRKEKETLPFSKLRNLVEERMAAEEVNGYDGSAAVPRFEKALAGGGLSFICEIKKASPSKGLIDPEFHYLDIARDYEEAGADCISCLTEPGWFLGSDQIFREIRDIVSIPMIRKDFTVDEYQILQAKAMGADAVLLICALLDDAGLKHFLRLSDELGLSALTETHDEKELDMALGLGARMIGVNNRDLRTFEVDVANSLRLRELAPPGTLFVSESGVRNASDIATLKDAGVDAVLVGEALMRATDRKALLSEFRNV